MALLSSSGKCGGSGGESPPPARILEGRAGGVSGGGDSLLPPTLYCPVLPPWHLALLTHHALHARGLSGAPGAYLPLSPVLASLPQPQGFHLSRASQGLSATGLPQSPVDSLSPGLHRRDITASSPTKHGLSTPSLLPTTTTTPATRRHTQPPRRSFTIADLLGGSDDLQHDPRDAPSSSSSSSPPAGGHDPLIQEGAGRLYDDPHDPPSALHQQEDFNATGDPGSRFEWLQCTRYHPPKLPRVKRREGGQKRKLGRNPRVPFSSTQLAALETRFRQSQYLSSCDVADLSALLNLTETRVKIWFQNRRARERRDREARAKGLLPPASSSSSSSPSPSPSSSSSSSCTPGPVPPSALALYQFTAALGPGSLSAFTPVMPRPLGDAPPAPLPGPASETPGLEEELGDPSLTPRRLQDLESPPVNVGGAAFLRDGASGSPQPRLLLELPPPPRSEGVSPPGLTRPCQAGPQFLLSQQTHAVTASPISP